MFHLLYYTVVWYVRYLSVHSCTLGVGRERLDDLPAAGSPFRGATRSHAWEMENLLADLRLEAYAVFAKKVSTYK